MAQQCCYLYTRLIGHSERDNGGVTAYSIHEEHRAGIAVWVILFAADLPEPSLEDSGSGG